MAERTGHIVCMLSAPAGTSLPQARINVTLADVSRPDVAAEPLAQLGIVLGGRGFPLRCGLAYDLASIIEQHAHEASARVVVEGKLVLTTTGAALALTQGYAHTVTLALQPG